MSQPVTTINYLPSFVEAKARDEAPALRTCDADGTHHFSQLKRIALSGRQYLHAVNSKFTPSPAMLLGTAVHAIVLGQRADKPVVVFAGKARSGKAWDEFEAAQHPDAEIVTAAEWARAEEIADSVLSDPVARERLDGSRFEVPLAWEEDGLKFSTSGIDILGGGRLGDLKTSATAEPARFRRQVRDMHYAEQLALYRRGCLVHGIDVSKGMFIICAEVKAPFDVVVHQLTDRRAAKADRTLSGWIETLRNHRLSIPDARSVRDWPGHAQAAMDLDIEEWEEDEEDEETES